MSEKQPEVVNNEQESRFELEQQGQVAVLMYRKKPGSLTLTHTGVPPELEGQGIASKLSRTALEYARSSHLKVIPQCEYVIAYLRKHPEYNDLVA